MSIFPWLFYLVCSIGGLLFPNFTERNAPNSLWCRYAHKGLCIYTDRAVFVVVFLYGKDAFDPCLLSDHIIPLLYIMKRDSLVWKIRSASMYAVMPNLLHSLISILLPCPRLSCSFRVLGFCTGYLSLFAVLSACFCSWQTQISVKV